MEKSRQSIKADIVNTIYEKTRKGIIKWEYKGKVNIPKAGVENKEWHSDAMWKAPIPGSTLVLYRDDYLKGQYDRLTIVLENNGAWETIHASEIDGYYIVNPIKTIYCYLETIESEKNAGMNYTLEEFEKHLKILQ